jgi:hypothetical protein
MTTSGTTVFNPDFIEAIEEAFERCGVEARGGFEMRTARRSINLMFVEWANRGLNMWTIEERSMALTADTATYTLESDIIDLIEHVIQLPGEAPLTRYTLTRVSVSGQAGRTNPSVTGRPTEIYINRQVAAPIVHLWPIPDQSYTLAYWVLRRMDDAGAYGNTADMPFRFYPAFIAGLAFHIAEKKRQDDPSLISRLQQRYEIEWLRAADEDRDRSTLTIAPRIARVS